MGIHTSIYRERYFAYGDDKKYKIKLFKGNEEIKLENAVSLREQFYFGKSAWAINNWLYKYVKRKNGEYLNEDFSYECIYDESIWLDDLKRLLECVRKVLAEPEKASKILPMPRELKLLKPKETCFDEKTGRYVIKSEDDLESVPREEMYDEYYFEILKRAKGLLEQIIREDEGDLVGEYIIEVI